MPDKAMSLDLVVGASLAGGFNGVFRTVKDALGGLSKTAANLQIGSKLNSLRAEKRSIGGISEKSANFGGAAEEQSVKIGQTPAEHRRFSTGLRKMESAAASDQRKQAAAAKRQESRRSAMPLLGAAYAAGRLAGRTMEVEEQHIHLRNVIQPTAGDRGEALARSAAHAREAARTSPASEFELLELQYQLSSGGLDEEQARTGSVIAANLARVTRGASGQAAAVMAQVENTLGGGMERIGDVLAKTRMRFAISDFGQLGNGMAEAAAGAAAARLPLEQTAAAIGMLNKAGQTGGAAGASLSAVLRQLGAASNELGFAMVRGADESLDLGATLQSLDDRLPDAADIEARNEAIQRLFGDEGMAGLVPLLDNFDSWRENLDAVDKSTGTVSEAVGRLQESVGSQWTMLTQNLQMVGSAIAGTMLPSLNKMLPFAAALAGRVGSLVERFPLLGQVIGWTAVAIGAPVSGSIIAQRSMTFWAVTMDGPVVGALKTASKGVAGLIGKITSWNAMAALTAVKTKLAAAAATVFNAALWASPITWVVGGMIALAGAAFLLYKYWEPVGGFFSRLWGGIKSAFSAGWTWVAGSAGGVWEAFQGALSSIWESIKGWFGSLDMASLGRSLIETLAKGIEFSPVGLIYKALKSVLGQVGRLLPGSDAQEGPLSRLTAAGASIVGTVGAGVRSAGADGLRRPLTRTLGTAAAGLALTLPPPPAFGGEVSRPAAFDAPTRGRGDERGGTIIHAQQYGGVYVREWIIHQQPGEDPRKLAERVIEEIEYRAAQAERDALFDIEWD